MMVAFALSKPDEHQILSRGFLSNIRTMHDKERLRKVPTASFGLHHNGVKVGG